MDKTKSDNASPTEADINPKEKLQAALNELDDYFKNNKTPKEANKIPEDEDILEHYWKRAEARAKGEDITQQKEIKSATQNSGMKRKYWSIFSFKFLLLIIGIGLISIAIVYFLNFSKKEKAEKIQEEEKISLARVKKYPIDSVSWRNIGVDYTSLQTKYENVYLVYKIYISLQKENRIPTNFDNDDGFTLNFYDSTGFKIVSIPLNFNDDNCVVMSDNGIRTGYTFEDKWIIPQTDYQKINSYDIYTRFKYLPPLPKNDPLGILKPKIDY